MAKVGKLNVEVGASTRGLRKDLGGAERLLDSFKSEINRLGDTSPLRSFEGSLLRVTGGAGRLIGGVTKALGALGVAGVAAGAGLGVVAASQIDLVGDQADAAKKLGLTRNELITLQRAAMGVGVDSDKLTASFEKMSDVLGSAFRGDSGAVKAIEGIGLSVADLQRMDPAKRFMAIGQAIDNIDDPAARIAAARDIFGKAGGDLIPMFEGGAGAIAGAYNELHRFGNLLSDLDVSAIEKAGDSLDLVRTMAEGAKTQLAAISAPILTKIVEDTDKWVTSMGGIEKIADDGLGKLADGFQKVGDKASYAATWASIVAKGVTDGAESKPAKAAVSVGSSIFKGTTTGKLVESGKALFGYGQEYVKEMDERGEELPPLGQKGRRFGPKKPGLGTAVRDYAREARENAEDDFNMAPRRSEAAEAPPMPRPVSKATSAWGRVSEEHGLERGRPTWQDRIPEGEPAWKSKVPVKDEGPANWESKRPEPRNYVEKDPMAAALAGGMPAGKAQGTDMGKVETLLEDIKGVLKGGVVGRLA